MAKTIKDLREEKGYRSAREFADAVGIATSSMSRYDRDPETIPMKHAIAMANLLGCSIDEIVGRAPVTSGRNELQDFYDGLLPETRALMDDFIEFARAKDEKTRRQHKADEDRKYEGLCRFHERMFLQGVYENSSFDGLVAFATPAEERVAFEQYLRDKAAEDRKPGIDLHCEGLEEEMRGGYLDADGTERHFSEEELQKALDEERAQMDEEYGRKDEEVIARVMQAYDRLHSVTIEYFSMKL